MSGGLYYEICHLISHIIITPMMTHDIFQRVRKKSAQKENRNLKTVYRILAIQYN